MQLYKSIYFPDFPAKESNAKNLKVAFGKGDEILWKSVDGLSSEDIRARLGSSYLGLRAEAETVGLSLNALCVQRLREALIPDNDAQLPLSLLGDDGFSVDPIQVTFRGGIKEPLQGWYPYLEGYSPEFVKVALARYAPTAKHILDPFGGTGTTPLTSVRLGLAASYCELNPLLQILIDAKVEALTLSAEQRQIMACTLHDVSVHLQSLIGRHRADQALVRSYKATFGSSKFFDDETFDLCLRARTWLDVFSESNPVTGKLACVALTSALIPSSNLIRRGDVRFRKGDSEWAAKSSFLLEAAQGLRRIAADILSLEQVTSRPRLVVDDAKLLSEADSIQADAVLTSPPYLNGTNYYRNTKVELWFIRSVRDASHLADFRRRTVTAGINDVTVRPGYEHTNSTIQTLVRDLEQSCYDRRIPQMASHYFEDMRKVLIGLRNQSKASAPLLMDIGDSTYGGIHVDTPAILAEMMEEEGWRNIKEVTLRRRVSRSGLKLRQVLLVGELSHARPSVASANRTNKEIWRPSWDAFKNELPHQKGDFSKRNWGSPLHSLCSYQGKMKPALAKHLVETFVPKGGRMLDVFTGVGTIPFEAASIGAMNYGFDISPAALPVALAKTSKVDARLCQELLRNLGQFLENSKLIKSDQACHVDVRFNGPLESYFHPKTFQEILLARRFFESHPPEQPHTALVFASLLHVLHGNRPYALSRRSHPITPFAPTGDFEYKSLIEKVTDKVVKSLAIERSEGFVYGETIQQDATDTWPDRVDNLDAIITSPPFFDSTRFYLANWMRLWMAGWTASDFKSRPSSFVDERQKQAMTVYTPILCQAKERLRPGGVCVLHLGESKKCDMAAEIQKLAKPFFPKTEVFAENVEHCESHGIRDKGTVTSHTYLILS